MPTSCDRGKRENELQLQWVAVAAMIAVLVGIFVYAVSLSQKKTPPLPESPPVEESLHVSPDAESQVVFRPRPSTKSSDLIRKLPVDPKPKPKVEKLDR
ncbi:hypothetical protein HYZ98_02395 [Candidatus Peregrinibacteria bacterium]|nr:hypothetical protein [Candidatus Peregrinibacteria bacterium]